ncbi:MAG: hypothetical protein PHT33_01900 [bacterium]|nr:hypothetical protein [bacterium]
MIAGIGIRGSRGDIDDFALYIPGLVSHMPYRRIDILIQVGNGTVLYDPDDLFAPGTLRR